jgi:hypothetical protein
MHSESVDRNGSHRPDPVGHGELARPTPGPVPYFRSCDFFPNGEGGATVEAAGRLSPSRFWRPLRRPKRSGSRGLPNPPRRAVPNPPRRAWRASSLTRTPEIRQELLSQIAPSTSQRSRSVAETPVAAAVTDRAIGGAQNEECSDQTCGVREDAQGARRLWLTPRRHLPGRAGGDYPWAVRGIRP